MSRDRIDALADELFAAARAERPTADLVERVQRASEPVDPVLLAGEPPAPPASSMRAPRLDRKAAPPRPRALRSRLAPVLLAAIACGGLALLLLPHTRDAVLISAERTPSGATPAPRPSEAAAPPRRAHDEPSPRSEPSAAAPPDPHPASLDEAPTSDVAPRPRAVPPRAPARPPAPESSARARSTSEGARPQDGAPATTPPSDAPTASSSPTLVNELGALKQIRRALRNHEGGAALALLDRYDGGEYGTSLALEARMLRVDALDAVGRRAEAETLARRFIVDNPDSPLAERAQRFIDRIDPARRRSEAQPR